MTCSGNGRRVHRRKLFEAQYFAEHLEFQLATSSASCRHHRRRVLISWKGRTKKRPCVTRRTVPTLQNLKPAPLSRMSFLLGWQLAASKWPQEFAGSTKAKARQKVKAGRSGSSRGQKKESTRADRSRRRQKAAPRWKWKSKSRDPQTKRAARIPSHDICT